MAYTKQKLENAIETLKTPSKHIRCVHETKCGMEFKTYSADLVRAFEVAIEVMEEKNNDLEQR